MSISTQEQASLFRSIAFFTRNLLILTDNAGHTGVGEVPGGENIRSTLEEGAAIVVGRPIGNVHAAWKPRAIAPRKCQADHNQPGPQLTRTVRHRTDERQPRRPDWCVPWPVHGRTKGPRR